MSTIEKMIPKNTSEGTEYQDCPHRCGEKLLISKIPFHVARECPKATLGEMLIEAPKIVIRAVKNLLPKSQEKN